MIEAPLAGMFVSSPPSRLSKVRARGESLSASFATLNAGDFARADSFVGAIVRGARAATVETAHARDCAEDPETLRNMGFWGVDRDDF